MCSSNDLKGQLHELDLWFLSTLCHGFKRMFLVLATALAPRESWVIIRIFKAGSSCIWGLSQCWGWKSQDEISQEAGSLQEFKGGWTREELDYHTSSKSKKVIEIDLDQNKRNIFTYLELPGMPCGFLLWWKSEFKARWLGVHKGCSEGEKGHSE